MTNSRLNSLLNDLLIELQNSLPQYIEEAWVWTADGDGELRQVVDQLAERHREGAARLVGLLQDRNHEIDFGTYPQEYTSLHYVALEYLLTSLKSSQQGLRDWIESLLPECASDPQAENVVREIAESQRLSVQALNGVKLAADPQAAAWMK